MAKTPKIDEHRLYILKLFRNRCVMNPSHAATDVNEIMPRGRTRHALEMPQNRVPLCRVCHRKYHDDGITSDSMREMHQKAKELLERFGEDLDKWQ